MLVSDHLSFSCLCTLLEAPNGCQRRWSGWQSPPRDARAAMCFALIKMYAARGDHDRAFDSAEFANRAVGEVIDYGAARHRAA